MRYEICKLLNLKHTTANKTGVIIVAAAEFVTNSVKIPVNMAVTMQSCRGDRKLNLANVSPISFERPETFNIE